MFDELMNFQEQKFGEFSGVVVSQQVEVVEVVASSRDFLALQCSWRGSGLINLKIS